MNNKIFFIFYVFSNKDDFFFMISPHCSLILSKKKKNVSQFHTYKEPIFYVVLRRASWLKFWFFSQKKRVEGQSRWTENFIAITVIVINLTPFYITWIITKSTFCGGSAWFLVYCHAFDCFKYYLWDLCMLYQILLYIYIYLSVYH